MLHNSAVAPCTRKLRRQQQGGSRCIRGVALLGAAALAAPLGMRRLAASAFVPPAAAPRSQMPLQLQQPGGEILPAATSNSAAPSSSVAIGAWAIAAALAAAQLRRGSSIARRAEVETKVAETKAVELKAEEAKPEAAPKEVEEKKEPFDVWKPDTYGNITMDDVKKYGAAGTLAYVLTELAFWAVAIPTECGLFYQGAGRWPDFSNDYDKAAVLGFVFAASNIARLCLPLRFGAALALAPWVDENIMQRFGSKGSEA